MRIKLILLALIFLAPVLASCSGVPFLTPYKMEIRQGNFVTAEMRGKLKLGMSRQQVRYVLGTPLVSDAFHGNRWDYVYRLEQDRKIVDQQHLTLYFEGDKLVKIDDDGKPDVSVEDVRLSSGDTSATTSTLTTVAPVVSSAPAAIEPVAVEAVQPMSDPSAEVWQTIQDWAAAWSAKDVRRYLAFYAPEFKTGNMSRGEWEKQRASRIEKIQALEVTLSDLIVSVQADGRATATFTQTYRSDRYQDVTRKIMQLEKSGEKSGGTWLIVSEQITK